MLTLDFGALVFAEGVRVWEHANPALASGFVKRVDVIDEQGTMHLVWQGTDSTLCGDVLDVRWERTDFLTQRVRLTTQTSVDAWEYVDAVQLVGHSSATRCIDVPRAPSPPPPPPCVSGSEQQQFAATATTSSEYGGGWSAADATGATTHSSCSTLSAGSWAPGPKGTETHTLTLGFATPLYMSGLEVWEAANPQTGSGFVRRLDAIEPSGTSHLYWEERANDVDGTACGAVFSVSSPTTTSFLVSHVKITTRTNIRAWEYVDAVRMSGYACSSAVGGGVLATPKARPPAPKPPLPPPPPPPPPPCVSGSEQQQFAATATTSSEYGGGWSAADATGATTHSSCSTLSAGSWAPGPKGTETHTLTLGFATPLYMSGLEVWEAANPQTGSGFVRRLDAIEPSGTSHLYWEERANDVDGTACGAVFSVSSPTTTSFLVSHVKITTRTNIRAWEYVDAVRMSGYACSSAVGGSVLATSAARLPSAPPTTKTVVLTLTASGSVSDYSDTSSLQQKIATAAGVDDKSLVTISVAAASVIITANIAVPASTTATAVQTSL